MSKSYYFKFGIGNPIFDSGLSPTFVIFSAQGRTTILAPGISSVGSGFYTFAYGPTLPPVAYLIDGGSILAPIDRYIVGVLDPVQAIDQQIGFVSTDSPGTTIAPPTIAGMFRRFQEQKEGHAVYSKQTGVWQIFSRALALLRTKQVTDTNTSSTVTGSS